MNFEKQINILCKQFNLTFVKIIKTNKSFNFIFELIEDKEIINKISFIIFDFVEDAINTEMYCETRTLVDKEENKFTSFKYTKV